MRKLTLAVAAVTALLAASPALAEGNPQRQQASCVGVFSSYDAQTGVRAETSHAVKALAEASGTTPGSFVREGATFRVDGDKVCGLPTHP